MVFLFVGGPMFVGGLHMNPGRPRGEEDFRSTALFSLGLMLFSVLVGSSYPYLVPVLTVVVHLFPNQVDRLRDWFAENLIAFAVGLFCIVLLVAPFGDGENQLAMEEERGQREYRRKSSQRTEESSIDYYLTVVVMLVVILLPQIWLKLNSWALASLSEPNRRSWRRWTDFMQPNPAPVGSVPASKSALDKLEEVVLEERHLLAEGSPGGITCAVCLENMKVSCKVKRLPCGHMFHGSCVFPWLEKHNSCPTCRFELETSDPEYERERLERVNHQQQTTGGASPRSSSSAPASPSSPPAPSSPSSSQSSSTPLGHGPTEPSSSDSAFQHFQRTMEGERLRGMSIVELKALARYHNISIQGCVEKRDLVERILAAQP